MCHIQSVNLLSLGELRKEAGKKGTPIYLVAPLPIMSPRTVTGSEGRPEGRRGHG